MLREQDPSFQQEAFLAHISEELEKAVSGEDGIQASRVAATYYAACGPAVFYSLPQLPSAAAAALAVVVETVGKARTVRQAVAVAAAQATRTSKGFAPLALVAARAGHVSNGRQPSRKERPRRTYCALSTCHLAQ